MRPITMGGSVGARRLLPDRLQRRQAKLNFGMGNETGPRRSVGCAWWVRGREVV